MDAYDIIMGTLGIISVMIIVSILIGSTMLSTIGGVVGIGVIGVALFGYPPQSPAKNGPTTSTIAEPNLRR